MPQYAFVEKNKVVLGPQARPTTLKRDKVNVTGLQHSDDAYLMTIGWYIVETVADAFDPATEILDPPVYTVLPDRVQEHFAKRAMTAEELAISQASAAAEAAAKDARKAPGKSRGVTVASVNDRVDELINKLVSAGVLDA